MDETVDFACEISYFGPDTFLFRDLTFSVEGYIRLAVGSSYTHPNIYFNLYRNSKETLTVHVTTSKEKRVFILKISDLWSNVVRFSFTPTNKECIDGRVVWTRFPKEW